jgi:hypothetical protein
MPEVPPITNAVLDAKSSAGYPIKEVTRPRVFGWSLGYYQYVKLKGKWKCR